MNPIEALKEIFITTEVSPDITLGEIRKIIRETLQGKWLCVEIPEPYPEIEGIISERCSFDCPIFNKCKMRFNSAPGPGCPWYKE